ncbi:MAG: Bifunctional protein HldE [Myxococcota bacterium]|nr:Bifunctional protein HldE [Myxococcota bacterium]
MSLVVIGSVALDTVKTPFGEARDALGGSATFFSASASYHTQVRAVAVVGEDFPQQHLDFLSSRGVDLTGVSRVPGQTFRWSGEYGYDLNNAETRDTQLNVFASFKPVLPESYRDAEYVFLANIDPELQLEVVRQVRKPKLIACDTMNFWINGKREALLRTLKEVHLLVINEAEARQLGGEFSLVRAARAIHAMGPEILVVKRGEYGSMLFQRDDVCGIPAFPLEEVFDPTGAGDTFAGGLMGSLAKSGRLDRQSLGRAIATGTVMASFVVEKFSLDRMRNLTMAEIEDRYKTIRRMTHYEEWSDLHPPAKG